MRNLHLAQFNIGRMRGPLEGPVMGGFVARLDEINALSDGSPGFVWRLQTDAGNATYLRPYDDDRIIYHPRLTLLPWRRNDRDHGSYRVF